MHNELLNLESKYICVCVLQTDMELVNIASLLWD
jgi:hypothetical protein